MSKHSRPAKIQKPQRQPISRRIAIRRFLIILLPLIILAFPFSLMNAHLVTGSISYQATWDQGRITRSADLQSWSVVNDLGYTVIQAPGVEAALDILRVQADIALVLSDIELLPSRLPALYRMLTV